MANTTTARVRIACRVPGCGVAGAVFLGTSALCSSHYCEALEALAAVDLTPRQFEGDPLQLVLLERVREEARLDPAADRQLR